MILLGRKFIFFFVTFVTVLAIYSVCYSNIFNNNQILPKEDQDWLLEVIRIIKKKSVAIKTNKELVEAAANGMLSSLDPHSSYLSREDFEEMSVQTKGTFAGLGIEVTMENSLVKVISSIDGTPAKKVGIKSGDYISRVDGVSVVGLNLHQVVKKLRGEPNTKVVVTILRRGEKKPLEITIYREFITIESVKSSLKEGNIAYIKINNFSEQAYQGLFSALQEMVKDYKKTEKNNIKGVVLDLRDNPGGLLDQAVKISDLFLEKGKTIVSIGKEDDAKIYKDKSHQSIVKDVPVVVIINQGSASASEIVAGALQDNKRAIILGTRSFGKGSVQSVIPTKNKGAIKITTSLYYTPSNKSIQALGITPDIEVSETKLRLIKDDDEYSKSESDLNGHLENQITEEIKKSKNFSGEELKKLYETDYQLARALELIKGISIYSRILK